MITERGTEFEAVWREVVGRAVTAIRRKGTSQLVAEDAVQEAVSRAIARDVPYADADDLLRWIQTVAWRIVLDARKRDRRLVYGVPDAAGVDDTQKAAESRVTAVKLRSLLNALSDSDLQALASRDPATMDRRESVKWAVRRHRVRTRLIALLDGAAAVVPWLRPRIRPPKSKGAVAIAMAAPIVVISVLTLLPGTRAIDAPIVAPRSERLRLAPASVPLRPTVDRANPGVADGPGRTPTDRVRDLPGFEFDHAGPAGPGSLWGKPKEPGDHLACVDVLVLGHHCVDVPVTITE